MRHRFSILFVSALAGALALTSPFNSAIPQTTRRPSQTIPRTLDGHPDFTGVWAGPGFTHKVGPNDTDTAAVTLFDPKNFSPFKPGGEALLNQKVTGDIVHDDPTAYCLPDGHPREVLAPYATQILQPRGYVVILYEYHHFFRVIPTDGRPHRNEVDLTYMGDATAKWEGDTLVIDTIGLKEWPLDAFLSGGIVRYHSDALHTIERIRYTSPVTADYQITIDDPKIFTAPWSQTFQMRLHPTWQLLEHVCEENNRDLPHLRPEPSAEKR